MNNQLLYPLLLEMGKWQMVVLNDNLEILKVMEGKNSYFSKNKCFIDYFDDHSKEVLLNEKSKNNIFSNLILTTKNGKILEIIILKEKNIRCFLKELNEKINTWNKLLIFYQNFLNSLMPMFYTDSNGIILDANKAFLDLYGYELEEVVGKNPRILKSFRQSPHIYKNMWESILDKNKAFFSGEVVNRKKDGREVTVFAFITTVFNFRGEIVGFIATHSDMTKIKYVEMKAESEHRELETLYKKFYETISIVSHDLKGPLNSLINYIELAKKRQNYKECLDKSLQIAFNLNNFIKETLTLSKIELNQEVLRISRCHIFYLLYDSITCFEANAKAKNVQLKLITLGDDEAIGCDYIKTEEIINNLLDNAIKHTPAGGVVTVEYINEESFIKINFKDEGEGVKEDLNKIFMPFVSGGKTKDSFGLGLYIVKKYIELHNWKIEVQNRKDKKGTIFSLIIDKSANKIPSAESALIFDPSNTIIDSLEKILKSYGINIFITKNQYEIRRVYGLEKPNYLFLYGDYLDEEIIDFLRSLDNKVIRIIISSENKNFDFADKAINEKDIKSLRIEDLCVAKV